MLSCMNMKGFFGGLKLKHFFLILESQTANTCPVDRISFAFIHQRQYPGGDIQKKVIIFRVLRKAFCQEFGKMCGNM